MIKIALKNKDITKLKVDAIVNAANKTLLGGGGVDGAIHSIAGPELLKECAILNGCQIGEAKITKGYNLPSKYVIHTVGPFFGGENGKEKELLKECYINSLKLSDEYNLKAIVFPAISTGAYRYSKDEAAQIAIESVKEYIRNKKTGLEKIIFAITDEHSFEIYNNLIK